MFIPAPGKSWLKTGDKRSDLVLSCLLGVRVGYGEIMGGGEDSAIFTQALSYAFAKSCYADLSGTGPEVTVVYL